MMNGESNVFRVKFKGLVKEIGGVHPAAAILEEAYGVGHPGTVSKMCNGPMAVTVEAMYALENALLRYPLTEYLADRIGRRDSSSSDTMSLVAAVARESGEAVESVLSAYSSASVDPENMTDKERAHALKEVGEAVAAYSKLHEKIKGAGNV